MRLNAQKCFYLNYRPRGCSTAVRNYSIDGVQLERKTSAKDLGVLIREDLKFHEHVAAACKMANKEINLIRRTFTSRNPSFLSNMYKMYVRPRLEYCNAVWNPVYSGDCDAIEKTQNRFTRMLRHGAIICPQMSVTDALE